MKKTQKNECFGENYTTGKKLYSAGGSDGSYKSNLWLNVAAHLYNPFGDDDDDFAVMGLMNRHIKVCMKIVDDDKDDIPDVGDDEFWKPPPSRCPR